MLESLQFEFESVKNLQKQQLQEQVQLLERNHNVALSELNNKVKHEHLGTSCLSSLKCPFRFCCLSFTFSVSDSQGAVCFRGITAK